MARPPVRRRRRLLRAVVYVVGGVIVLAAAAVALFIATFDPNSYKPQIIAAVQSATGRTLTIGGPIGLSLSLQPTLEVSEVGFSNPPGFSRPQMATLQRLELQLALIPLLSKRVQIEQLVLQQPDILLETNAQGQSNWKFSSVGTPGTTPPTPSPEASPAAPTPSPASPPASPTGTAAAPPPSIALSSLKIEGGTLTIRDATGRTTTLGLTHVAATATSPNTPMHLTMDATYNAAPLSVTADTGPLIGLLGAGGPPWPIKLAITAAGAKFGIDGTIAEPMEGRGIALAVTADIPDLAALTPFAGTPLPPLKNLTAQLKLADAVGSSAITVSDLTLTLPKADLAGSASVQPGDRPLVKANLSFKQIDLDALSRAMSTGKPDGSAKPAAPAARSGRIIPDTKLPLDALRQADADVQLAIDDLISGGQDYKAVKLHLVLQGGKLTLDPATVNAAGGQVDLKLTMDANPASPPVTLTLRAPSLSLQALLKALGKPGYASGTLELRADLSGTGDSPHAIAASLDGAVGVAVEKGQIDSKVLGGLMSGLLRQSDIGQLASKAGMSTLNCFALRLNASHGVGTLQVLKLDSSTLSMDGTGGMNFGTETLDMHLKPSVGVAGTNITTPVVVTGTFADPSVKPDPLGLVTGNAGTAAKLALGMSTGGLALMAGSVLDKKLNGDPCAGPLALARFSQPPATGNQTQPGSSQPSSTAPPATQSKPSNNPVGALKKLFQ
jgi:uncharacterized protein involved in outer membrane biogenesis